MSLEWRSLDTATSHFIPSSVEAGTNLHLRAKGGGDGAPVLFVHGAGISSRVFDISHPGASWMDATVAAGMNAYALDVRGYGLSHSLVMENTSAPYGSATDAINDIDDAVNWISNRHAGTPPALVGMSWGSVTTSLYASTIGADKVASLSLVAPIFAERNQMWIDMLADPADITQLNPEWGAFRYNNGTSVAAFWDSEIPEDCDWRDGAVSDALIASIMSDDPTSSQFDVPQFRAPNGTFVDLWECFNARPVYDPSKIIVPVLLVRGSQDRTSTRSDALNLFDALGVQSRQYIEIANGSHFLVAERQASHLFAMVNTFSTSVI